MNIKMIAFFVLKIIKLNIAPAVRRVRGSIYCKCIHISLFYLRQKKKTIYDNNYSICY